MRFVFELVDSAIQIVCPNVSGHHTLTEGLNKTKGGRRNLFLFFLTSLLELRHLFLSPSTLRLGITPSALLVFRPSDLD